MRVLGPGAHPGRRAGVWGRGCCGRLGAWVRRELGTEPLGQGRVNPGPFGGELAQGRLLGVREPPGRVRSCGPSAVCAGRGRFLGVRDLSDWVGFWVGRGCLRLGRRVGGRQIWGRSWSGPWEPVQGGRQGWGSRVAGASWAPRGRGEGDCGPGAA